MEDGDVGGGRGADHARSVTRGAAGDRGGSRVRERRPAPVGEPAAVGPEGTVGRDQTAGAGYVGYSTPETYWTTRMTWQE
ncbi:hypothetical protein GCM10010510_70440 [Streptomyces anandii JCM 4720]|nr:hypothetical protein GCM10010510_70440 [Streptomyces anandii JCM 4720]